MSIALLGTGYWGKNIGRVLKEESLLFAICDQDSARAAKFSDTFKVPILTLLEILSSDCVAVAIALPAEMHFEVARKCLLAGKHVFVEKPLALSTSESLEILKLADDSNLQVMVGHILQFHNCFKKFKEIIKSNKYGELKKVEATRMSFGKIRNNENVMWSFAPHDISMILSLVNSNIQNVSAQGVAVVQDHIFDTAKIDIKFKNGVTAEVISSWLSPFKRQTCVATTSKALIIFDDTAIWDEKLRVVEYNISSKKNMIELNKREDRFIKVSENEPLKSEIQFFWQVVCGKEENLISDAREGLKVVEILERAEMSIRSI